MVKDHLPQPHIIRFLWKLADEESKVKIKKSEFSDTQNVTTARCNLNGYGMGQKLTII